MMSVERVAIFWVVNASSGEKSCLQFSIPTGSGPGGEGGVSYSLNINVRSDYLKIDLRCSMNIEIWDFIFHRIITLSSLVPEPDVHILQTFISRYPVEFNNKNHKLVQQSSNLISWVLGHAKSIISNKFQVKFWLVYIISVYHILR